MEASAEACSWDSHLRLKVLPPNPSSRHRKSTVQAIFFFFLFEKLSDCGGEVLKELRVFEYLYEWMESGLEIRFWVSRPNPTIEPNRILDVNQLPLCENQLRVKKKKSYLS